MGVGHEQYLTNIRPGYHQLFGHLPPLLYYPIQQTPLGAEVRVWQATHQLPRLAFMGEDVAPAVLQDVVL